MIIKPFFQKRRINIQMNEVLTKTSQIWSRNIILLMFLLFSLFGTISR